MHDSKMIKRHFLENLIIVCMYFQIISFSFSPSSAIVLETSEMATFGEIRNNESGNHWHADTSLKRFSSKIQLWTT